MPCVCCVYKRVVEGSGVGSAGCVMHVDMCMECQLCCATEHGGHGRYCNICGRLWSEQC